MGFPKKVRLEQRLEADRGDENGFLGDVQRGRRGPGVFKSNKGGSVSEVEREREVGMEVQR